MDQVVAILKKYLPENAKNVQYMWEQDRVDFTFQTELKEHKQTVYRG
jgi:hypothetical protein